MKYIGFFAIIVFLISCKKDKETKVADELIGKWELTSSSGGIAGTTINYSAGSGNTTTFDGSLFKEYRDNKLTRSGSYIVKKQISLHSNREENGLVYEGIDQRYFFNVSGAELSIHHDAYDGFINHYKRIN